MRQEGRVHARFGRMRERTLESFGLEPGQEGALWLSGRRVIWYKVTLESAWVVI